MAIVFNYTTAATLAGARDVNRSHRAFAQQDVGYKIERMISAINILQTTVSSLTTAAISAAGSAATWSAFSGFTASTLAAIANLKA